MDLPNDTPAGSEALPEFAGKGGVASDAEPAKAREFVAAASVAAGAQSTHVGLRGRLQKIIGDPRRIWASPFVLWTKGAGGTDSTPADQKRRKTGAHTSPDDAQGQSRMIKRNLPPIVATVGVAALSLALHSCGQKPAPAAETPAADKATADRQAMRVTRVAVRNLSEAIEAKGRLVVREEAAVGSELPGYRVAQVYVDEGDWVKQGQPLARLDDTLLQAQIAQVEATLATQKATADFQQSQLERAEMLTAEGAFSKEQLEQRRMQAVSAKAALAASQAAVNEMKVRQSRMTLRAPVAGAVLERNIRPGEISGSAMSPYFRISRDGLIELDAELPDAKLALIKEGDPVRVTLLTGETLQGKVRFISPRVDATTALGRARVELPFNKALRPCSFSEAHFEVKTTGVLTVPASSIRYEAGGQSVMLVGEDNKVMQVPVKLGERTGDYVALIEGPSAGSRVLTVGAAFVLDGDVINPVEEGVASTAAAPGGK